MPDPVAQLGNRYNGLMMGVVTITDPIHTITEADEMPKPRR